MRRQLARGWGSQTWNLDRFLGLPVGVVWLRACGLVATEPCTFSVHWRPLTPSAVVKITVSPSGTCRVSSQGGPRYQGLDLQQWGPSLLLELLGESCLFPSLVVTSESHVSNPCLASPSLSPSASPWRHPA